MKAARRSIISAALFILAASLSSSEALALQSQKGLPAMGLETAEGIVPVRREVQTSYTQIPKTRKAAWDAFLTDSGSREWQVMWDSSTSVPLRIFGKGIEAKGVMQSPQIASKHALWFLKRHAELLAPGVDIDHLIPAANEISHGQRTVAFKQMAADGKGHWLPVVRGQVSLRYKNDRLFVIASEIVPSARAEMASIDSKTAEQSAVGHLEGSLGSAEAAGTPELVVLPLIRTRGFALKTVWRVRVRAGTPGGEALPFDVYIDAVTGMPVARENRAHYLSANALFGVPSRYPGENPAGPPWPAKYAALSVNGANAITDAQGAFSWAGPGDANVIIGVKGNETNVSNYSGTTAQTAFTAQDGGQVLWSAPGDEFLDAQLTSFIHATRVKEYIRQIAPELAFVNSPLQANVNKKDQQFACNAYWDGSSVNFFTQSGPCNNTGRLADVIYHEVGHGFHQNAAISGAGVLDPSLGEGQSDYLACTITGDPDMAPGFFINGGGALRHCQNTRQWPVDIQSDPHETGLIFTGAMWDLRTLLVNTYGEKEGVAKADALYHGAISRASSIPTTYAEVLATDDDDGDLANGTPNICAINEAFVNHGIAPYLSAGGLMIQHSPLTLVAPTKEPLTVAVSKTALYPQCGSANVDSIRLQWGEGTIVNKVDMQPTADGYAAEIPAVPDGTALRYRVVAKVGGNSLTLPNNPADDQYRVFVGNVTPIYCNDFEAQIDGWDFSDKVGGKGDFKWGIPEGIGDDPATAFSGDMVIGNDITIDGQYEPDREVYADSPLIDLQGNTKVRLQFRRWLNVEDGFYDQATVYVNDKPLWYNQATGDSFGSLTHSDKEWIFEDIDLSQIASTGGTSVHVRFELSADSGFETGGWTIDDFCVVAWTPEAVMMPPPDNNPGTPPGNSNNADGNTKVVLGCGCETHSQAPLGALGWLGAAAVLGSLRFGSRRAAKRRRDALGN